jgi:BASS family bile acid:Na+ symporter
MDEILDKMLGITLIIFMVGSLLEVGLRLDFRQAVLALGNLRFLLLSLTWAFVLCPVLALLLTAIIPLAEPYAVGLLFLGMAPCAPFVPLLSQRAHGDLAYVAAFMLLSAVGTVVYMPLMTPVFVKGFTAGAWTIARPLLFFIAAPMAIGILVRWGSKSLAEVSHPIVKKVTGVDTIIMLGIVLWIYRADILSALGSYAIGTQFLFYGVIAIAADRLAFGLEHSQKSVLVLGVSTRNIGAAFAPLVAVAGTDRRTVTMVVMAVPISVICGFATAHLLARRALKCGQST